MKTEDALRKIKDIAAVLEKCKGSIAFDSRSYFLSNRSLKGHFEAIGVELETCAQGDKIKIRAFLENLSAICFEELQISLTPDLADKTFCCVDREGRWFLFDRDQGSYYSSDSHDTSFYSSIANCHRYQQVYNLIRSPLFADHHNSADKEIVIYSSAKGILKITYDSILPRDIKEIEDIYTTLHEIIRDGQLKSILKNTLFTFSNGRDKITLDYFLSEFWNINDVTMRDYEIVLKQFDFDKVRDLLIKEKDKFFSSIREVISKVFNQAIGIPISISATVFATYKVEEETFTLWLILIGFLIYIVFYIIMQAVYFCDIQEIKKDFESDFEIIRTKSGLQTDVIERELRKIDRRITTSKRIISFLMVAVILLGLTVSLYLLEQILDIEIVALLNPLNWEF